MLSSELADLPCGEEVVFLDTELRTLQDRADAFHCSRNADRLDRAHRVVPQVDPAADPSTDDEYPCGRARWHAAVHGFLAIVFRWGPYYHRRAAASQVAYAFHRAG
jgi:hypothetical protein